MSAAVERVLHHAVLWSEGSRLPGVDAIAIGGGRIRAIGTSRDLTAAWPAAEIVDAGGATVTPGLTDAHIHLLAWARSLDELDLTGAASAAEAARRVARQAAGEPGSGAIVGRGWDELHWSELPERGVLDAVAPARPVLLHRHDFHALWVNGEALRRAGVTRGTPDPEGGVIVRDASGEPTGILRENAVRLCRFLEPLDDESVDRERLRRAAHQLHARGVTAVHVFEGTRARRLLRALAGEASGLRILMSLPHASLEAALAAGVKSGAGDSRFRIGAIKFFSDGTLGSRTASVLAPYAGGESTGMDLIAPAELERLVARAANAGLASAVHAIGDRAVRSTLDAFESAHSVLGDLPRGSRIEHVQLADPADLARFAPLGITASLQPTHAISDIESAERAWEGRLDRAYPWRSLLDRGARLAFGSDAPVEPPEAALTLHAAVTRERVDGTPRGGWDARQRLTLDEALSASIEEPARLAGSWPDLGRLSPGAEADLVLWDRDLHACPPARLHEARPRLTLLAGRTVFGSPAAAESTTPTAGLARGAAA